MTETCYQKYTADYDRKTVHALLTEILSRGYTISVNDGEEWTLNQSSKINEIKAHLATSGEDLIRIWDNDNTVGSFYLIYENGSEYMETICDHTFNEICDSIYKAIDK